MAEKLSKFDWSQPSQLTTGEKAVYPWTEWLDGDIWKLTYGEDFQTHPLMMERIIRTRATARRARVTLRHLPGDNLPGEPFGVIVLQRSDTVGPAQQKRDEAKQKREAKKAAAQAEAQELVQKLAPSKRPTKRPGAMKNAAA